LNLLIMNQNPIISSSFLSAGLLLSAFCTTGQAATIFNETFTATDDTDLSNLPVTPSPQTPGDQWKRESTVKINNNQMEISQSGTFGKAWAPFDDALLPVGTQTYTFSYDFAVIDSTWGDSGSSTFYGGLGNGSGTEFVDFQLGIGFHISGNFADDLTVQLRAGAGGAASGFDDVITTISRASDSTDWAASLSFTYTVATGAIDYYLDGNPTAIGSGTYNGDIGGIWFKADSLPNTAHAGFLVDDVLLTNTVPESSSYALITGMLGLAGAMIRRRR
jgi:hypothetical protein